jgi:hypothetical protein
MARARTTGDFSFSKKGLFSFAAAFYLGNQNPDLQSTTKPRTEANTNAMLNIGDKSFKWNESLRSFVQVL